MWPRKEWFYAALLAAGATLTRAVGVSLIVPTMIAWIRQGDWADLDVEWRQIILQGLPWRPLVRGVLALTPLITFLVWKYSYYGLAFDYVEQNFFGSTFMDLAGAYADWTRAFQSLSMDILQRGANYSLIIVLFILALVACPWKGIE